MRFCRRGRVEDMNTCKHRISYSFARGIKKLDANIAEHGRSIIDGRALSLFVFSTLQGGGVNNCWLPRARPGTGRDSEEERANDHVEA